MEENNINFNILKEKLAKNRRIRISIMSLLLFTLIFTAVYGTLENPFRYTLSNIGNLFTYREFFIIWGIVTGIAIQSSSIALFKLEKYTNKIHFNFIIYGSIFLILTAIIPAVKAVFPFWHTIHVLTSAFYALFVILGLAPFVLKVSKENPRLQKVISIWLIIILGGAILSLIIFGMSAIFELWFIVTITIFLMYLSMTLFEEEIVKESVVLLKDEENLNLGIEKIFGKEDEKK